MKILALFLFVGLASAASLHQRSDDEIQTELGKTLKDGLDRVLEKIKDAVDEGRHVRKELVEKMQELRQKLKDIKVDVGSRSKQLLQDIKEKARDYLKEVLERLGLDKKERSEDFVKLEDMLRKVKEHLKNNVDPELLKEKLEKIFGQGSALLEHFLSKLKEMGRKKLEMLIDSMLEDDHRESRSIKEYWEKVKNFFKDLKIDLQEKYSKFGEWVKDNWSKGMETSKDKLENITAIAKEFIRHGKNVSKEVGAEASEFFDKYKEDLKNIWGELKETLKQIRNREE